ncbi:MAG: inorganic phosphate transporter, partial [Defluviitaleaceae bacterium]|nr:inorganic phosphate transporter [Defluviitaleaceae bacterium]
HVILAALCAAIIWGLVTWRLGLPSSSSHAVIGGLVGASLVDFMQVGVVNWFGVWNKVILWLFASPLIGFVAAFLLMNLLFELLRKVSQYIANKWFSKLQIVSASLMAFSHGSNDAQKTMGIITMALVSITAANPGGGTLPGWMLPSANHPIPLWVIIACGAVMAAGTSLGGWRIIKTMGVNMIKLNPVGGFAAETAAAAVIEIASANGIPLSTTHVISASIMGVGAAKRFSAVRWTVARDLVFAWVVTIPVAIILGGVIDLAVKGILRVI